MGEPHKPPFPTVELGMHAAPVAAPEVIEEPEKSLHETHPSDPTPPGVELVNDVLRVVSPSAGVGAGLALVYKAIRRSRADGR